jgi:hypothetical protein
MYTPKRHWTHRPASMVVGLAVGGAATNVSLWLVTPCVATATMLLVALAIMVVLTALYAPTKYSNRAFRMLPWATGKRAQDRPAEARGLVLSPETTRRGKAPRAGSDQGH